MSTKNRKIWAAGVLLILTVAAAIGFLFRLSQPDQEQRSVYLNCTESDRGGWVFFTEAGPVEPVFGFGGYINGIPAEGTGPVAAERVMGSEASFTMSLPYFCESFQWTWRGLSPGA